MHNRKYIVGKNKKIIFLIFLKTFIKPLDVKEGGITYEGPTLWQSCGDDTPHE